jgi:excinuclease UvrABC nuclease subunit
MQRDETEYERDELVTILEKEMMEAAEQLEFEKAARLRDQLNDLKTRSSIRKYRRSEMEQDAAEERVPGAAGTNRKGKKTRKHRR